MYTHRHICTCIYINITQYYLTLYNTMHSIVYHVICHSYYSMLYDIALYYTI